MPEAVNHPQHYGGEGNAYETIAVLAAWMTPEQLYGFCIGNSLKYMSRAGKKTGCPIEDLKKAIWYCKYLVERLENQVGNDKPNA